VRNHNRTSFFFSSSPVFFIRLTAILLHPLVFHRDLTIFFAIFLSPLPRYFVSVGAGTLLLLLPSSSHCVVESCIEKKEGKKSRARRRRKKKEKEKKKIKKKKKKK